MLATLAQRPPTKHPHDDRYRCSFCQRPRREVPALVAGPGVFICDSCVGGAVAIVQGRRA
ncbi:MAG: hypothetical protein HOV81_15140 [Kofleriaceae bacterium]|nr:hypothetical protein [Kofleriaceae bacterium]